MACLACGSSAPPLELAQGSREELAAATLAALERRDVVALRRLALSEQEFRDHVWPGLPASRPERNLPFSYVWGDLRQKSEAGLGRTVAEYGGRHFDFVSIRTLGAATEYPGYSVERQAEITVKAVSGQVERLRLFGSILHKDGKFKIFSFVTDD